MGNDTYVIILSCSQAQKVAASTQQKVVRVWLRSVKLKDGRRHNINGKHMLIAVLSIAIPNFLYNGFLV